MVTTNVFRATTESYTVIIVFDSIAVTFKLKNKRKIGIYFLEYFISMLFNQWPDTVNYL